MQELSIRTFLPHINMARKKQTKGKQKIEMKKIENDDDRIITFSKRRSGIYKKASELITLCGAEIGILVFSPAGKPFSFGCPSLESISNRFLGHNPIPNDTTHPLVEAHRKMRIHELTQQHNEMISSLDAEKERGEWLNSMMNGKGTNWWDLLINELNVEDLHKLYAMCEEVHTNLCKKLTEASINLGASSNLNSNLSSLPPMNDINHHSSGFTVMNNSFVDHSNVNQNEFSNIPNGYGFGNNFEPQATSLRKFYPRLG